MRPLVPLITSDSLNEKRWLDALRDAAPTVAFCPLGALSIAQRDAVKVAIVANPDPAVLAQLPNLEWMQSLWAGVDGLVKRVRKGGPRIVRLIDPCLAETMAESVLAWTFYLHKDMPRYRQQQDQRFWRKHDVVAVKDRAVALLGLGSLGQSAAEKLKQNGFIVRGWSRTQKSDLAIEAYSGEAGLRELLKKSTIVVLLLPLTSETMGILDARRLGWLPRGASLINFGRGQLIAEDDLLHGLDSGHLGHAVLDVFNTEPLPSGSSLWRHPSVTVLPHIAAPSNLETSSAIVATNLQNYFHQGVVPQEVDRARGY